MKKLPEVSAPELAEALHRLGYQPTCRSDAHICVTTTTPATLAVTLPDHSPLKPETLAAILAVIAPHHRMQPAELAGKLFG